MASDLHLLALRNDLDLERTRREQAEVLLSNAMALALVARSWAKKWWRRDPAVVDVAQRLLDRIQDHVYYWEELEKRQDRPELERE